MNKKLGLVHIYTGNGKGKTTTSIGLGLRAAGQNFNVYVIQFLKGGAYTGEYISIQNKIHNIVIKQFGKLCIKQKKQLKLDGSVKYIREDVECGDCRFCFLADNEEKLLALEAFEHAKKIINSNAHNVVILDEINNAIDKGLITVDKVIGLIKNKPDKVELVLSGRNAPEKLYDYADYVSVINEIKHPMNNGIYARRGIEY